MTAFRKSLLAAATLGLAVVQSTGASAYQRWIDVHNDGAAAIWSVRISHVDDGVWGRDLLGAGVIPGGDAMRVEPDVHDGYCRFDILVTYETGAEVVLWGVDLCSETTLVTDERDGWIV